MSQPHYNNDNGSLYLLAEQLGLNHWEFDIFKRLVRCRQKGEFESDLDKIKDTVEIYKSEFKETKSITKIKPIDTIEELEKYMKERYKEKTEDLNEPLKKLH